MFVISRKLFRKFNANFGKVSTNLKKLTNLWWKFKKKLWINFCENLENFDEIGDFWEKFWQTSYFLLENCEMKWIILLSTYFLFYPRLDVYWLRSKNNQYFWEHFGYLFLEICGINLAQFWAGLRKSGNKMEKKGIDKSQPVPFNPLLPISSIEAINCVWRMSAFMRGFSFNLFFGTGRSSNTPPHRLSSPETLHGIMIRFSPTISPKAKRFINKK